YIPSAVTYFERLRQIELRSNQIVVLSGPFSLLLASDAFQKILEQVLCESSHDLGALGIGNTSAEINQIIETLRERRTNSRTRKPHLVNLISTTDIERFLRSGLRQNTRPAEVSKVRQETVYEETLRLAAMIEEEEIGVQIGVFTLPLPRFHIFRQPDQTVLSISPFRLADEPNTTVGVAMITSDPDALTLHEQAVSEMWRRALKGAPAAEYIRNLVAQVSRE